MYDLTFGQNGYYNKKNNEKNHMSFMPHVFNQSRHPFSQCIHFNLVETFEKPWYVIVLKLCPLYHFLFFVVFYFCYIGVL
jgi:hypothetical protein